MTDFPSVHRCLLLLDVSPHPGGMPSSSQVFLFESWDAGWLSSALSPAHSFSLGYSAGSWDTDKRHRHPPTRLFRSNGERDRLQEWQPSFDAATINPSGLHTSLSRPWQRGSAHLRLSFSPPSVVVSHSAPRTRLCIKAGIRRPSLPELTAYIHPYTPARTSPFDVGPVPSTSHALTWVCGVSRERADRLPNMARLPCLAHMVWGLQRRHECHFSEALDQPDPSGRMVSYTGLNLAARVHNKREDKHCG